jgi:hypothetical protein
VHQLVVPALTEAGLEYTCSGLIDFLTVALVAPSVAAPTPLTFHHQVGVNGYVPGPATIISRREAVLYRDLPVLQPASDDVCYDYLDDMDDMCYRAIEGRPFVDMSGKHIQASAKIGGDEEVCWSASASSEIKQAITEVYSASQELGSEWTTRALGEHASISSFAAFTIALMSNNAPPGLVQDALLAALDEV